jgi:hypothetical protein
MAQRGGGAMWLLAGAALIIAGSQIALAILAPGLTHASAMTIAAVLPLILLIGLPAGMALAAPPLLLRMAVPHRALLAVFITGCAIRLIWFAAPPMIEDDFYRYLWDGAVLAHGFNPYTYAPSAILAGDGPAELRELAAQSGSVIGSINFPHLRSIYPGTAEAAFALAHWLAPWDVNGLRALFLGAELATFLLLVRLLRDLGLSPLWSALYWCNAFPAVMLIGQAHADALLPPMILGAVLLSHRQRFALAGVCLALAAGVKLWPVLLAPLLMRPILFDLRRLVPAGMAMGGVLVLVAGPLMLSSLSAQSGLTAYAAGWANNNAPYAWTLAGLHTLFGEGAAVERGLRLTLAGAGAAISIAAALRPPQGLPGLISGALLVSASVFYLSPAQFPWYAVWFLPLAALARNGPLLLASALLPVYYLFFPLWQTGRGDLFLYGAAFLHSVPVFAWLLWREVRRGMWFAPLNARAGG